MICNYCGGQAEYVPGKGWIHKGGGAYVVSCDSCGWVGSVHPTPVECPRCESPEIRDDHCILPVKDFLEGDLVKSKLNPGVLYQVEKVKVETLDVKAVVRRHPEGPDLFPDVPKGYFVRI